MIVFSLFIFLSLVGYGVCLYIAAHYWQKMPTYTATSATAHEITIVIAFRNVATFSHLKLLQDIENQTVLPKEIILVDDHSTDNTPTFVAGLFRHLPYVRIVQSPYEQGKKNALRYGVEQAQTPYVLFTDIDTQPHENWIASVADFLQNKPTDMLILPVFIDFGSTQTTFEKMQALEYAALQTLTGGWAACQRPIMCAGANLAFRRQCWLESLPDMHNEIPSGDDMFMLHSFKRHKRKIAFLKSPQASVWVLPAENVRTLIRQRARWAAKATAYTDFDTLAVGSVVLLANMLILVALGITICTLNLGLAVVFCSAFLLKYAVDTWLLQRVKNFFELEDVRKNSLLLSLIYPIYTLTSIFIGFFRKKKW